MIRRTMTTTRIMATLICLAMCAATADAKISWGSLAMTGIEMEVQKKDSCYALRVKMTSDTDRCMTESPTMLIKDGNGDIMELKGELIKEGDEYGGSLSMQMGAGIGISVPYTMKSSTAIFNISKEQLDKIIENGALKMRIESRPKNYDKEWIYPHWLSRKLKKELKSMEEDIYKGF